MISTVAPASFAARRVTVGEFERRGGVLVVRIERANGALVEKPKADEVISAGDGVAVLSKLGRLGLDAIAD